MLYWTSIISFFFVFLCFCSSVCFVFFKRKEWTLVHLRTYASLLEYKRYISRFHFHQRFHFLSFPVSLTPFSTSFTRACELFVVMPRSPTGPEGGVIRWLPSWSLCERSRAVAVSNGQKTHTLTRKTAKETDFGPGNSAVQRFYSDCDGLKMVRRRSRVVNVNRWRYFLVTINLAES